MPVGTAVLPFRGLDSAVEANSEVEAGLARHAAAAHVIADKYLDSCQVLTRLFDEFMNPAPAKGGFTQ